MQLTLRLYPGSANGYGMKSDDRIFLCHRDCREFVIEGPTEASVAHAMSIIVDAVNRYKTLCEGKCAGQVVPRSQHVAGVEFFYQPPPRSIVPFAACLKGHSR